MILTSPKHEESWKGPSEEREEIGGFRYYRTGALPHNDSFLRAELRLMTSLGRRMREVIEIEKPDLIHSHSPVLNAIPALRVARKLRLPVVYEIRAFWEDAAVDHGTYKEGSWKYRLLSWIETWVCHKVDRIAILCRGLRNELIKRGIPEEKITVVFNGVDPDDFRACELDAKYQEAWNLDGKKVIAFIGSFYRYEGIDLLVEAFARLAAARSDMILLLVGGGEVEAELKRQVRQLDIEEKVVMPGRIPHDQIAGVYASVDILAYPRYRMRLTELVTPLKPLEAMAAGKAVVASDVGGHRELIQHGKTGLLFTAGDVSGLTESLAHLLDDDTLLHNMQHEGTTWVKQEHTWDKTTSVYQDIYDKAIWG